MEEKDIDFSLKATTEESGDKTNSYCNCLVSLTEIGFYLPLAIVCTGIVIITHI